MKFRIKATVLAIFLGWFPFGQSVQYPATGQAQEKAEVLDADASYRNAVISGDAGKLANLLAGDILIVHSDGGTDTKVNFLDAISSRRLRLTSYERSDVQVRIYGSTALLFSKATKVFTYRGGPGRATDTSIVIFARSGNRWRIVAMQNTPRSE
jgi:ketosteroid isomerase-like protein